MPNYQGTTDAKKKILKNIAEKFCNVKYIVDISRTKILIMQDTEKDAIITPFSFRARYEALKQLVKGKNFEIARRAGCTPARVDNAIYGKIVSPDLLHPILEAMEAVAREEFEKIQL